MTETDPKQAVTPSPMANNVVPLPAAPTEPSRPSAKIVSFVKRHPVLTVAGAVAAGIAVSAVLPRRTGRKALGKALSIAEAAGTASLIFGREAGEKAQTLGAGARDQVSLLGSKAGKTGHDVADTLEKYGLAAIAAASAVGRATARRAGKLGHTAAEQVHQVSERASEHSHKVMRGLRKRAKS